MSIIDEIRKAQASWKGLYWSVDFEDSEGEVVRVYGGTTVEECLEKAKEIRGYLDELWKVAVISRKGDSEVIDMQCYLENLADLWEKEIVRFIKGVEKRAAEAVRWGDMAISEIESFALRLYFI